MVQQRGIRDIAGGWCIFMIKRIVNRVGRLVEGKTGGPVHLWELLLPLLPVLLDALILRGWYRSAMGQIALIAGVTLGFLELVGALIPDNQRAPFGRWRLAVRLAFGVAVVLLIGLTVCHLVTYFQGDDVITQVKLHNNLDATPKEQVSVDLSQVPAGGDRLAVTFRVENYDDGLGFCESRTRLMVQGLNGTYEDDDIDPVRRDGQDVPGKSLHKFTFPKSSPNFVLLIQNLDNEKNCSVNVYVEKAELTQ
jgi:hypothetical protein